MSLENVKFKPSFQAKILLPVVLLLVLLPAITVAIVHRSSMDALNNHSQRALQTADALFQNSLDLRARQLVARYKNIVSDPRFRAISKLADPATMKAHLEERLESAELGDEAEVALFLSQDKVVLARAVRDSRLRLQDFERAASESIQQALGGQSVCVVIPTETGIFNVVSIPVVVDQRFTGVLVVGVRIGVGLLRELTHLIHGEGAFLAHNTISVSTLPKAALQSAALPDWKSRGAKVASRVAPARIENTHYLVLASPFPDAAKDADVGYVLLISYESALQQLRQTQATLWLLCIIGITISTGVILFVVRKVTAPLRQLRTNAEAVGGGDFSRVMAVCSTDELGQLSHAFNQMTHNLRLSHSELEKAVETLKATQAQLIQSEKLSAVGEFVSGIAHELNNPLTSIVGFGELLKEAALEPKHQKSLQYIVRSSERCHKIVHGLLSFARQHPPERKLIEINVMIDVVIELLAYEMRTSNIEVERRFQNALPKCMGDSHQLQQVVLNILNNARQAMEAHKASGRIIISTEASAEKVRITIQDNGPGIAQEHLSKIFDPFFTTKPVGKGTGLGLSLCYGIMREHGGAIIANSKPGEGATFLLDLPAQQPSAADQANAQGPKTTSGTGAGKRALVIDDEVWILDLVRQILKLDGYEVDVTENGDEALDRVSQSRYELLVCDWKMPGLSGRQLFERISDVNPEAANRVIFMTGDVVSDSFQQFLTTHSKSCLAKPFSIQEFRNTISNFVAARN